MCSEPILAVHVKPPNTLRVMMRYPALDVQRDSDGHYYQTDDSGGLIRNLWYGSREARR